MSVLREFLTVYGDEPELRRELLVLAEEGLRQQHHRLDLLVADQRSPFADIVDGAHRLAGYFATLRRVDLVVVANDLESAGRAQNYPDVLAIWHVLSPQVDAMRRLVAGTLVKQLGVVGERERT